MEVWSELILKEELTESEIRQIPSRSAITQLSNIDRYKRNGWNTSSLSDGLQYSIEELSSREIWLNPLEARRFEENYYSNLPKREPHYQQFDDGVDFIKHHKTLEKVLIKALPIRFLFDNVSRESEKFNNEYKISSERLSKRTIKFLMTPYPFFRKFSFGHECHFVRGIYHALLREKKYLKSSVRELCCSADLRSLVKNFYSDSGLYFEGEYLLKDEEAIAERCYISLDEVDSKPFKGFVIKRDLFWNGEIVLKKGEIYNAPSCCFIVNHYRTDFLDRFVSLFFSEKEEIVDNLQHQLVLANKRTQEAHQLKVLVEKERDLRDEFLANTAHEIRTPLNGIIGIIDGYLNSENCAKGDLSAALSAAKRLSFLVNDIVDYSKIMHMELNVTTEVISIWPIIDLALTILNPLYSSKKLKIIKKNIDYSLSVIGDENRILQILYNIIGNGIKYTDTGKISISTELSNNMVSIIIQDTGIGISDEKIDKIFRNYVVGDIDKSDSTGIGLYLTKKLIELMDGSISVESNQNGSTFTVSLLSHSSKLKKSKSEQINITQNEYAYVEGRKKVWIVDDDPINLKTFGDYLSPYYNIHIFHNRRDFFKALQEKVPDLILLDLILQNSNGIDICKDIRKVHSRQELPVIIITARSKEGDLSKGLGSGANDFLYKPVIMEELHSRVNNHITLMESHREIAESERLIGMIKTLVSIPENTGVKNIDLKLEEYADKINNILRKSGYRGDDTFIKKSHERLLDDLKDSVDENPFILGLIDKLTRVEVKLGFDDFCRKYRISNNQKEVLYLFFKGKSYSDIGSILDKTSTNVRSTMNRIFDKVGVDSQVGLMANLAYIDLE